MKKIIFKSVIFLSSLFIVLVSVVIILSFNTSDESKINTTNSGWQLQTNLQTLLNGRTITDMTFIDSLTGFAACGILSGSDTGYLVKTTNGGNNWFINFSNPTQYSNIYKKIIFVNNNIGYACGTGGTPFLCKTTDQGITWVKTSYTFCYGFVGMSILGTDTIYIADDDALVGGVFRSTNGGQNWQNIYSAGQYNPRDIYMINGMIGFYNQGNLYKTINGGYSWTQIDNLGFRDIKFFDTLIGYRITQSNNQLIQKTTNGGLTWITQILPNVPGGTCYNNSLKKFSCLNKDSIWLSGSYMEFGPSPYKYRGIINKTTNGGINWGYQLPDTHIIQMNTYYFINFLNNNIGWAYLVNGRGIYTTIGGDSTILLDINFNTNTILEDFKLEQNYPNPFNPLSSIKFQILRNSNIKLVVYNIIGKEITTLVNEKKSSGTYKITFDGSNLSSGIYFYSLFINGVRVDTKKMLLIK